MEQTTETAKVEKKKVFSKIFRYWPWMLVILCVLGLMLGYYIRSLDNSVAERGTKLRVNKTVSDHLKDEDDKNWYTFTLPADGYITIQLDHPALESENPYWLMYLYYDNKTFNVLGGTSGWMIKGDRNKLTEEIGLPAGTYYIKVVAHWSYWDTSTYSLRVNFTESNTFETEYNGSEGTADVIKVNSNYTGCSMTELDSDWYAVTIPDYGLVTFQFEHPLLESGKIYWYMGLYESDKETRLDSSSWKIYGDKNLLTSEYRLAPGTYYIYIVPSYHYGYDSSTYTLRVNYAENNKYETEDNDYSNEANEINLNSDYYGEMTDRDDDWYTFTIPSDGHVTIRFDHPSVLSGMTYFLMILREENEIEEQVWIDAGKVNDGGSKETMEYTLQAGKYYILLTPNEYWYRTVEYSLRVDFAPIGE